MHSMTSGNSMYALGRKQDFGLSTCQLLLRPETLQIYTACSGSVRRKAQRGVAACMSSAHYRNWGNEQLAVILSHLI